MDISLKPCDQCKKLNEIKNPPHLIDEELNIVAGIIGLDSRQVAGLLNCCQLRHTIMQVFSSTLPINVEDFLSGVNQFRPKKDCMASIILQSRKKP